MHELGHLLGLAHSAVAGETSVSDNAYDVMSGLDMSTLSYWYWGFGTTPLSYICDGYNLLTDYIKCIWDYDRGLPKDAIVVYKVSQPGTWTDDSPGGSGESADAQRVAVLTTGPVFNGAAQVKHGDDQRFGQPPPLLLRGGLCGQRL